MNLVDCYVVRVLGRPEHHEMDGAAWWTVPVTYESWGREAHKHLMCQSEREAYAVDKGFHFLA